MSAVIAMMSALLGACSRDDVTVRRDPTLHHAPSAAPVDAPCSHLDRRACLETRGCILDQPEPGLYECRRARNACERAARHADIAGTSSDLASVTRATRDAAIATCNATAGCVVTSGRCSCLCAVLGECKCACGGGYLARCVPSESRIALEGAPRFSTATAK